MGNNINGTRLTVLDSRQGHLLIGLLFVGMLIFIGFFGSCEAPKGKTKKEVMNERIIRKVDSWYAIYSKRCHTDVLEAAAEIVDSTLIATARRAANRANKPPRPIKPGQPNVEIPQDTTPVAPLIDLLLLLGDTNLINSLMMDSTLLNQAELDSLRMDSILRADYEFDMPDTLKE